MLERTTRMATSSREEMQRVRHEPGNRLSGWKTIYVWVEYMLGLDGKQSMLGLDENNMCV
jgi:hypothetical protein